MGSINLVHGFRVLAHGKVTPGFVKALKRLEAKGYADEGCVVVKTTPWSQSAITHEGGRYLHPENPYARQVIEAMRHRGIEPPPLPFILAPGPMILYHEWGHHVDRIWSREDHDVLFSFRWFSHFYEISYRRPPGFEQFNLPMPISGPIETEDQAMGVMQQWPKLASELLAHLFEAWMRSREKPPWDLCEPQCLDHRFSESAFCIRLDLRGDVTAAEVQSNTFALFSRGIRDTPDQPSVREGLLGPRTFALLEALRRAMRTLRAGPFKPQQ